MSPHRGRGDKTPRNRSVQMGPQDPGFKIKVKGNVQNQGKDLQTTHLMTADIHIIKGLM